MKAAIFLLPVLASLGFSRPAHAVATAVPVPQAQCFQVQFLLRLTGLESGRFVRQVEGLREIAPDDPAVPARLHALSLQAAALRRTESQNFVAVGRLFRRMGVTPGLRTWAASETDTLRGPVVMTEDERRMAATQPDAAGVLATLDECDHLKMDTDDHITTLGEWISLTDHAAGLWAADVGELTAALHVGVAAQVPPRLAATLGRQLAATAPPGTPASVTDALDLLSPQMGNLSGLVPGATTEVPLPEASRAASLLLTSFSAQSPALAPP